MISLSKIDKNKTFSLDIESFTRLQETIIYNKRPFLNMMGT